MASSVRSARGDIEYDAQVTAMNRQSSPDAVSHAVRFALLLTLTSVANAQVFRKTRLLVDQNTVLRSVFQRLILESGVNWAADEALRAYMLESVSQM
jgi:hypothetical protein